MSQQPQRVVVRENYRDFTPPGNPTCAVERLLDGIPCKYLSGLKTVVLTNTAAMSRRKRQWGWAGGKKVRPREARGLYHGAWNDQLPWIEIFVDKVVLNLPRCLLCVPFFSDALFAQVLFHEIGHHIHATQSPEFEDKEKVADAWKRKLSGHYLARRYWYLMPVLFPPACLWKLGAKCFPHRRLAERRNS